MSLGSLYVVPVRLAARCLYSMLALHNGLVMIAGFVCASAWSMMVL